MGLSELARAKLRKGTWDFGPDGKFLARGLSLHFAGYALHAHMPTLFEDECSMNECHAFAVTEKPQNPTTANVFGKAVNHRDNGPIHDTALKTMD